MFFKVFVYLLGTIFFQAHPYNTEKYYFCSDVLRNYLKAVWKSINHRKCLKTRLWKNFNACFVKLDRVGYIFIILSSLKIPAKKGLLR